MTAVLIQTGMFCNIYSKRIKRIQLCLDECNRKQSIRPAGRLNKTGSRPFAIWLGFISCRYFHVCGFLNFWETTQRKWPNCGVWRTQTWVATPQLIWPCIFDKRLHIWKTTRLESLCQQAETEQQGCNISQKVLCGLFYWGESLCTGAIRPTPSPPPKKRPSQQATWSVQGQMQEQDAWHAKGPLYVQSSCKN